MRNLLEIETELLSNPTLVDGLQLDRIKTLQRSLKSQQRSKFRKQLDLAKTMKDVKEWFDLPSTQEIFNNSGVTWSAEELADKVFECGKSWMFKCIKASNVESDVVSMFEYQCKHLQNEGKRVKMGIEDLNQFAKAYAQNENIQVANLQNLNDETNDSVVEDTNDESVVEDTTAEENAETNSDTIFTLSFKRERMADPLRNVSVRISLSEGLVTTNSADEIRSAIHFLTEQLTNN